MYPIVDLGDLLDDSASYNFFSMRTLRKFFWFFAEKTSKDLLDHVEFRFIVLDKSFEKGVFLKQNGMPKDFRI